MPRKAVVQEPIGDRAAAKEDTHEHGHAMDKERVEAKHAGARMDRHAANGHSIKEQPKKAGAGGKGTWGTWKDDVPK